MLLFLWQAASWTLCSRKSNSNEKVSCLRQNYSNIFATTMTVDGVLCSPGNQPKLQERTETPAKWKGRTRQRSLILLKFFLLLKKRRSNSHAGALRPGAPFLLEFNEWACFPTVTHTFVLHFQNQRMVSPSPCCVRATLSSCVFAGLCGRNAPLLLSSLFPILAFRPNASTSIPYRSSLLSIPWCLSGFVPRPCYTGCGASAGLCSVKYSIAQGQLCKQAASGRNVRWDKQGWREKVLREQSLCQGAETYFK